MSDLDAMACRNQGAEPGNDDMWKQAELNGFRRTVPSRFASAAKIAAGRRDTLVAVLRTAAVRTIDHQRPQVPARIVASPAGCADRPGLSSGELRRPPDALRLYRKLAAPPTFLAGIGQAKNLMVN